MFIPKFFLNTIFCCALALRRLWQSLMAPMRLPEVDGRGLATETLRLMVLTVYPRRDKMPEGMAEWMRKRSGWRGLRSDLLDGIWLETEVHM